MPPATACSPRRSCTGAARTRATFAATGSVSQLVGAYTLVGSRSLACTHAVPSTYAPVLNVLQYQWIRLAGKASTTTLPRRTERSAASTAHRGDRAHASRACEQSYTTLHMPRAVRGSSLLLQCVCAWCATSLCETRYR